MVTSSMGNYGSLIITLVASRAGNIIINNLGYFMYEDNKLPIALIILSMGIYESLLSRFYIFKCVLI